MTPALGQISIYKPTYYMRSGSIVRTRYINSEDTSGDFPVTDSCERSATVMNEDYVKLSFKLLGRVVFDAFAYIWYDNQLFFLKETYRPTAKGAYYQYDMKFVSIANMFDKHLCFRYLSVPGEDVSPEPEINMNGTLDDMAAIVIDSIHGAASRLNVSQANLFYVYVLQHLTLADDTQPNTTLETFSFSGQYIPDVLTQIASKYEIEWWVSQESMTSVQLHLCKCERGDTVVLSDRYRETGDSSHPYASRGLVAPCEYAQEWSNIPQKIIPFGSDRNITRKQALQSVNGNDMYVSYDKQLRLAPNHTYTVKDREGNSVQATTDALGAFTNTAVRSGIETTKQFDNIYPRCHFRVLSVKKEGTEHPIYTITAAAIKADGESLMSYDEMVAAGLLPLQIEPNETLSIIFESGYLNGREFEVAYDIKEVENVVQWTLKIVPEEGGDDGVQLPFGNFVPREKSSTYEGDMFAIFHMVMPQYYIERAQDELAQAAYDELLAIEDTRPEVKCKTEPEFFANQTICLGQRVAVHSELFGEIVENAAGEIEPDSPSLFVSRVTSFTHSLTKPNNVEFKLASSRVEGRLAEIEATIADRTSDIRGLEQRSLNLSRRGWHDAAEMLNMLESLAAEMMVIGVEKNQFAFTPAILCVNGYLVSGVNHFDHLHVSAGYIQHTQEPYIKYANGGRWDINETDLTTDEQGNTLVATTPYYLYAICGSGANTAQVVLTTSKHESDTDYLLMGILSSEFLDDLDPNNVTSYRVFNRSNGYTQITGGTITTEQIQDPTRSLIIDLSSNPPRIIAVHGAEIIGNITFKSFKDENGNNVLEDMAGDISDALSAASSAAQAAASALTKATNIADDGIISAGTEKSTLKKEWQEVAGSNYNGTNNGSYFKACTQAEAYGLGHVELTYNFSVLKAAMDAILATATWNVDYVLAAGGASWNTKDKLIILWRNYYDSEIALLNLVSDTIDQREVGGENLYSGVDPLNIITTRKGTDIVLDNGKKYVISVAAIDGNAYGLLAQEKIGSTYSDLGWIVRDGSIGTMQHYEKKTLVVTGHGGKLALQVNSSGSDYYYTLTGIMVQQGEKPTAYHAGYLAKALEHDATKEVTSIDGGLLLSALIKLAQGGIVRAGMSGLADYGQKTIDGQTYQSEGVGFWAGSDYAEALAAACGIESNSLPPVFLSKTGFRSRIACFRVIDKDTIAVVTNQNMIYVTNKSISQVATVEETHSAECLSKYVSLSATGSKEGDVFATKSFSISGGKYTIKVPAYKIEASANSSTRSMNGAYAQVEGSFTLRLVIKHSNGTTIHTSSYVYGGVSANCYNPGESNNDSDTKTIPAVELNNIELPTGTVTIEVVGSYEMSIAGNLTLSNNISFQGIAVTAAIINTNKYVVFAKDGIGVIASSNATFYVKTDSANTLQVITKGLPTSATGLSSGQLYRDGNYLKIV